MPELPEVERGRKVAERMAAGRRILEAVCAPDEIVYAGVPPFEFGRVLTGRTVREVRRRGKQLWFVMDRPPHPLFHFGMTGSFRVREEAPLRLASSARELDCTWPPRFTKLLLLFEGAGELAFVNSRRLGRIRLREDPEREPPISRLGFDPLLDLPRAADLARRLAGRKVTIKGLLLDQSFAAGVGNWIADEVLYQAGIDPRRPAGDLGPAEVGRLRASLGAVIRRAVEVDAEKDRFPRTWLFHRRWGRETGAVTFRGEPIEHITVAGRTTAWVPTRQA